MEKFPSASNLIRKVLGSPEKAEIALDPETLERNERQRVLGESVHDRVASIVEERTRGGAMGMDDSLRVNVKPNDAGKYTVEVLLENTNYGTAVSKITLSVDLRAGTLTASSRRHGEKVFTPEQSEEFLGLAAEWTQSL